MPTTRPQRGSRRLSAQTAIVERAFDEHFHPAGNEPAIALAGFDRPEPRRLLGGNRFCRVVDAGLGAGHVEYLDMVLHTFPSPEDPADAFPPRPVAARGLAAAYESEINRQVRAGAEEAAARCGMVEVAGVTVGAAFVGAAARALAVADLLRHLHGGNEYSVISLDLRTPAAPQAVSNAAPGPVRRTGIHAGPSRGAVSWPPADARRRRAAQSVTPAARVAAAGSAITGPFAADMHPRQAPAQLMARDRIAFALAGVR